MESGANNQTKTILVVEDEPAISDVCLRVLTGQGFEVDIAPNGKLAREVMEQKQYHLYIIDMRTPVMSGKELYVWLCREHPRIKNRVLFTTGDVMSRDTHSFLEQSGRLFLPKPFTPNELKNIVNKALEQC